MTQIVDHLLKIIENEGIVLEHRDHVRNELDNALLNGCFSFIYHNEKRIGFFTWVVLDDGKEILWENMLIFKRYRGQFNVLSLRKILLNKYDKCVKFSWNNRRKKTIKKFNQRMTTCV